MNCEEFKNLISSYIEGDCLQKQEFERHMAECAACRKDFEETKKVMELCKHMPEVSLPEGFEQRLHERLALEAKPKKSVVLQLKQYKRGFTVGAAVVAASLVLVATPFLHLYDDSGNVAHVGIQDNPITGILPTGGQTPETTAEPDSTAEPVLPEQEGVTLPEQGAATELPSETVLPENTAGQENSQKNGSQVTIQQPAETQQPTQQPAGSQEVQQPAQQTTQPETAADMADATTPNTYEAAQENNVPAPTIGGTEANPVVSSGGGSRNSVGSGGGGSSAATAMATSLEPVMVRISASAENRTWVQQHVAGYGNRQTAGGVEIVVLTQAEYQALMNSEISLETTWEVPQAAKDLMEPDGYYVILK